jgi:hypothetical protein
MKLSPIADDLAKRLHTGWNRHCIWAYLRDEVDLMTHGEHTTWVLDKLTDMVKTRLPNR